MQLLWKDMQNMLHGDHILHTYGTHTEILIWKWISMVWVVSVYWLRRKSSDLESTFLHSVLRSMRRLKGSERSACRTPEILTMLILDRWQNVCNFLLWDCHIIQSGICTSPVWMIYVTWRLVICLLMHFESLTGFRKWRRNALLTRKKRKSVQSA
jgi:hypothetical protein